jgi:thioredoxin-like negative regulator of GroEL
MTQFSARVTVVALAAALVSCARTTPEAGDSTHDAAPTASAAAASSPSTDGWNVAQVDWQPYEAGLKKAKDGNKPVCLIFSTTWCPHCKNFSHVFEDPRIVARARDFVMVHLDADAEPTIAAKYQVDGGYIPRTYFLAPDGTLDPTIHATRPRSMYFYDERDPGSLLVGMNAAFKKLAH